MPRAKSPFDGLRVVSMVEPESTPRKKKRTEKDILTADSRRLGNSKALSAWRKASRKISRRHAQTIAD